ncbi:TraY domain-containing protein [Vibrio mediterranei]
MTRPKGNTHLEGKGTHVNVVLSPEDNAVLTLSAQQNGRTKREESQARLRDHLNRFRASGWEMSKK